MMIDITISTHALTWRATRASIFWSICRSISTHALTWRATFKFLSVDYLCVFLPTPSHGGRPAASGGSGPPGAISTHALTWRATLIGSMTIHLMEFLPTPSHGGRLLQPSDEAKTTEFLPTPSHGGRPAATLLFMDKSEFLPTPSHGGRPSESRYYTSYPIISTHALTWRATRLF